MLIYLDANIVQYCADYADFVFGGANACPVREPSFRRELYALRHLNYLEQFGDWSVCACDHLLDEVLRGRPSRTQRDVCHILVSSARPRENAEPRLVEELSGELSALHLQRADRQHLATALALGASYFVTNDGGIIKKTQGRNRSIPLSAATTSNPRPFGF